MSRNIEFIAAIAALVVTLVGGVVAIEGRYAKAADVEAKMDEMYAKQLKTRILELQLKPPNQFTPADRAMLLHLQQELKEATD